MLSALHCKLANPNAILDSLGDTSGLTPFCPKSAGQGPAVAEPDHSRDINQSHSVIPLLAVSGKVNKGPDSLHRSPEHV